MKDSLFLLLNSTASDDGLNFRVTMWLFSEILRNFIVSLFFWLFGTALRYGDFPAFQGGGGCVFGLLLKDKIGVKFDTECCLLFGQI